MKTFHFSNVGNNNGGHLDLLYLCQVSIFFLLQMNHVRDNKASFLKQYVRYEMGILLLPPVRQLVGHSWVLF